MNYVTKKNEDGGISNKGRGLSKVHDLLSTAFNQNVTEDDLEKLYKVCQVHSFWIDMFWDLFIVFESEFPLCWLDYRSWDKSKEIQLGLKVHLQYLKSFSLIRLLESNTFPCMLGTTEKKILKVHIAKEEKKNDTGKGFLKSRSETVVLNLWCFSPGFSMKNLSKLGARYLLRKESRVLWREIRATETWHLMI